MCLYPRLIQNRKYVANKKNKGIIPEVKDRRTKAVPVGCGNCRECKKKKSRDWQVRLHEEIRTEKNGKFVTLTFSDEELMKLQRELRDKTGYELENATATLAIRRFLERWRKTHKKSVRHWLITELGHTGTERIHIHGILWTDEKEEEIRQKWKYGNIWIGNYVNEKTINYIVKYVNKMDNDHPNYKSKICASAGIGGGYFKRSQAENNKYKGKKTIETYQTRNGMKIAMPIYYRNNIYTDEEREELWIQKLDEEVRYINGTKIDISTEMGKEIYYTRLKREQRENIKDGYGSSAWNWKQEEYENDRRMQLKKEREEKVRTSQK